MSDELYRSISDEEYRGEGYFEATFDGDDTDLPTVPFRWKGTSRDGDRFILQVLDDDTFIMMAVYRDGWRDPIPTYGKPSVYHVPRNRVRWIKPRP